MIRYPLILILAMLHKPCIMEDTTTSVPSSELRSGVLKRWRLPRFIGTLPTSHPTVQEDLAYRNEFTMSRQGLLTCLRRNLI